MTSVDTSLSPSMTDVVSTDTTSQPAADVAAASPTPLTDSVSQSVASLESMVSEAQAQLATGTPEENSLLSKVLTTVTSIIGALVSLVSYIVGSAKQGSGSSGATDTTQANTNLTAGSSATDSSAASASSTTSSSTAASSTATSPVASTEASSELSATPVTPHKSFFEVIQNDQGMITLRTLDGFAIRAEGQDEAWSITGPDGNTTRIWGDPHVNESDGDHWNFTKRGTFVFGNNKATIEVSPKNDKTMSARLTVYSGDERVTISGLDTNKPAITAVSHDGKQHDDSLADGTIYQRKSNKTGESWTTKVGSKVSVMGSK